MHIHASSSCKLSSDRDKVPDFLDTGVLGFLGLPERDGFSEILSASLSLAFCSPPI